MTGFLDMQNNPTCPSSTPDTSDACSAMFVIQKLQAEMVFQDGTQAMTGHLNKSTYYINNVIDPPNSKTLP